MPRPAVVLRASNAVWMEFEYREKFKGESLNRFWVSMYLWKEKDDTLVTGKRLGSRVKELRTETRERNIILRVDELERRSREVRCRWMNNTI